MPSRTARLRARAREPRLVLLFGCLLTMFVLPHPGGAGWGQTHSCHSRLGPVPIRLALRGGGNRRETADVKAAAQDEEEGKVVPPHF